MNLADIEYSIHPVRTVDLDQLFNMLVELVKHEGSFNIFKLTKERLENELFGVNADWHCLVASSPQGNLLGFCLYSFANINRAFNRSPMIQVDHLYITPPFRKAKIALNLIKQLAALAKDKKIGRLNVWCMKENMQGQDFYQKIGAVKRDFVDVYSLQVSTLMEKA